MATNCTTAELAELKLRRDIEVLERNVSYYAGMNDGGRYGHGRGNFSASLARARGQLEGARIALRHLTGK